MKINKKHNFKPTWISFGLAILILIAGVAFKQIGGAQSDYIGVFKDSDSGSVAARKRISYNYKMHPNHWFFSVRWTTRDLRIGVAQEKLEYNSRQGAFSRYIQRNGNSWQRTCKLWVEPSEVLEEIDSSIPITFLEL